MKAPVHISSYPLRPMHGAQVKPVADDEMFKVLRSGKRKNKAWKRMITKVWWGLVPI